MLKHCWSLTLLLITNEKLNNSKVALLQITLKPNVLVTYHYIIQQLNHSITVLKRHITFHLGTVSQ